MATNWFKNRNISILLCTSSYPTESTDVNLSKLITIQNAFPGLNVGFSDHTRGFLAASIAVGLGASIFEKHFTLDNNYPGPDHWFSEDENGKAQISYIDQFPEPKNMEQGNFLQKLSDSLEEVKEFVSED